MDDAMSAYTAGMVEAQGNNRNNNDGMFGGGCWWIWIILLFFFWGNGNGWGNNGNNGGGAVPYLSGVATRSDIADGFALNGLQRSVTGIQQGICDSTYALSNAINSGFNTANVGMLQGFNGVQSQLCNGFNGVQQGFNQLGYQMQDCCCTTQRSIDNVRYDMATQACDTRNLIQNTTRDVLDNNNANTRAILDFLTQDKISSLQAENQNLKLQASQANQNAYITATIDAQTGELIRRCCPAPVPAYQVPAPYPYCGNGGCGGCGC